jgi:hypothetical protein
MQPVCKKLVFPVFLILIASLCTIGAVSAANGTVTIAYRGSGGNYIGETIIFDGKNTAGNMTAIKISGPGLPAGGVPLLDATGTVGSGNTAPVGTNNDWTFTWDMNRMKGNNLLQTARYTFTAFDQDHPEISSTTSVMLKRPDFYILSTQNPVAQGEYVQLIGNTESSITSMRIDVKDASGAIVRTFISPVSASGYFEYAFHVDLPPGEYRVVISNPAIKTVLDQSLTVANPVVLEPRITVNVTPSATPVPTTAVPTTRIPMPTPIPLSPACAIAGITGAAALLWMTGRRGE